MKERMKESNVKHYSICSDILYYLRWFKKHEPSVLVCCAIEIVLSSVIPLIGIYLPKLTIDLVTKGVSAERLLLTLGLYTLFMMAVYSVNRAVSDGKYFLYNTQRTNMLGHIYLKSLKIPYEDMESGEGRSQYRKAVSANTVGDWSGISRMLTGTVALIISVICFILYSTVLGTLSVWLIVGLIILSLLNYQISLGRIKYVEKIRDEESLANSRYYVVKGSMGNVTAAKDIRIFAMKNWLFGIMEKALVELRNIYGKIHKKYEQTEKIGFLIDMARDLAAYAYLLYRTASDGLTAGEFVLYFGAVTGFSAFVTQVMDNVAELREGANSTDFVRMFMDREEEAETGEKTIDGIETPVEIEFKNVTFAYKDNGDEEEKDSNSDKVNNKLKPVFEKFNLTISKGEKVAIVGINGAGKTTFVKLLTGMLEPDEGQILINGIDRKEFIKSEYYKLFSVVFQEQMILPFTVGENLTLEKEDLTDEKKAWEALEKAGLKQLFKEKGIELGTFMTKTMLSTGVELSGGQQQRFLLARALYKDGPVLILDEPTAALDPIAESEIYESYNYYSRNKTAVFISHRLASTRFSDRIVMIENGKIIETGTHDELMNKNGAYAQMFNVQSSYYKED